MKAVFIIQGEGRGHMTQAMAMRQLLIDAGHEVSTVFVGTSKRREVPAFFAKAMDERVVQLHNPNFVTDKHNKSINLIKTFFYNILRTRKYLNSLLAIHRVVKSEQPDVVINFYDFLGGLYFFLFNPKTKRISIGHQYFASHSKFCFEQGAPLQKAFFRLNNWVTSLNSHKRLALSFADFPKEQKSLSIVPPLLRPEIFQLRPSKSDYLLAYVVNQGYADDIMQWHDQNKKVKIHCFWDNKEHEDEWSPWPNLTFHHLNDSKFLSHMESCAGYISTAGFESICEAMYLGKPVMLVPVEKQYEQACNAKEAQSHGAGITSSKFHIGRFLTYLSLHEDRSGEFRKWVQAYPGIILKEIEAFEGNTTIRKIHVLKPFARLLING